MLKKISKQDGFSYIDVMIAIVIMMVGVLALVGALEGAFVLARTLRDTEPDI